MMNKLRKLAGRSQIFLKKNEPEIFLTGGIVGVVGSAIMLAKAHKQSEEVFADVADEIKAVKDNTEYFNSRADDNEEEFRVSKADERRMLFPLYLEGARRGAIHYGPSVLVGVGSLFLIVTSHRSMKARNRALVGMVGLLERSFAKYRERVQNELGMEADERFYYGAESRNVTTVTVDENGKKKKKKGTENHIPEEVAEMLYTRVFDEYNPNFRNDDDWNLWFLEVAQESYNLDLQSKGWVPLNDVLEHLQFEKTSYGQVVGWSLEKGDGFVDFGLDRDINRRKGEHRYFLDFNVAGNILDGIDD